MFDVSWIKLSTSIFSNPKIQIILRHEFGAKYFVIWIYLLTFAGVINDEGKVYLTKDIPLQIEDFAAALGYELLVIREAFQLFELYSMISIDKKGIIQITNWDKYQNVDRLAELREYNRLAKQRERERKKNNVNDKSMTSHHRIDKIRKDKNTPPKAPSKYDEITALVIAEAEEVDNEQKS